MLAATALAEDDCTVSTEDYVELRAELRDLRRRSGRQVHVAGDAPECESALEALDTNDPFLGVTFVPAPPGTAQANVEHSLQRSGKPCGAVLEPGRDGWWLREVGECGAVEGRDRHLFTVGTWMLGGASLRYTRELTPGFSILGDVGVGIGDPSALLEVPASWGVMAGFDANKSSLKGGYLGMRGGLERVGTRPEEFDQSTVAQGIAGHRFVGKGATLQLGGGVVVRVPTGDFIGDREMEIGPMLEARLGLAR